MLTWEAEGWGWSSQRPRVTSEPGAGQGSPLARMRLTDAGGRLLGPVPRNRLEARSRVKK